MQQAVRSILAGLIFGLCACGSSVGVPRTLAQSTELKAVAVGLLDVFYVEGKGNRSLVNSAPKETSAEPSLVAAVDGAVSSIVVDDRSVYAVVRKADVSSILRISRPEKGKPSQQKEIVKTPGSITAIALDAVQLYFTQSGNNADPDEGASSAIMRTMRFGGTPFPVASRQVGTPVNLLLSATHVLWVNAEYGKQFSVMAFRKTGGEQSVLYRISSAETGNIAPALATDDSSVFLKTRTLVMKVPISGGEAQSLGLVPDSNVAPLVLDSRNLYFTTANSVLRFGLLTKTVDEFFRLPGILTMAVDDKSLFLLSPEGLSCVRKR